MTPTHWTDFAPRYVVEQPTDAPPKSPIEPGRRTRQRLRLKPCRLLQRLVHARLPARPAGATVTVHSIQSACGAMDYVHCHRNSGLERLMILWTFLRLGKRGIGNAAPSLLCSLDGVLLEHPDDHSRVVLLP